MTKPFVVVVGTDYSKHAERALKAAFAEALRGAPAELHVVHATFAVGPNASVSLGQPAEGFGPIPALSVDEQQAQLTQHLDKVFASLPGFHERQVRVFAHVVPNEPVLGLTALASALEAQLLVVGTHGHRGITRWLLGSVAEGAVRQSTCPVLVIPPEPNELPLPAVEPPCARCTAARASSNSREMWCEQHRERHDRRHTYYQNDRVSSDNNLPLVSR
jgi:nucleotide-binding universal stress UspA family protein